MACKLPSSSLVHCTQRIHVHSTAISQPFQHQGINPLPLEVALSSNDPTHLVPSTHPHAPTVSNFEDGEGYARPPVAAVRDSPSRLTWADQASSGEFIPKEALDLEEEYGGFSVNPDFLHCVDAHPHGISKYGVSATAAESRLAHTLFPKLMVYPSRASAESRMAHAQSSRSDFSCIVDKSYVTPTRTVDKSSLNPCPSCASANSRIAHAT
ncbi:hypothetical protein F0562_012028 [Nyssa sinensis]|uniref:Uncharacterized protein n=1 Tax=Nyssa sinensis TaxID=561372 RepID=A0A5J4ZR96_9ASTE|nr:hypothetical protein F0562_012028 [Nyssa sinensis]